MKTPPLITVVTISFNAREALERTIASVNAQTYANVEHVFMDGGSNDGSVGLIQRLARRRPRWWSEPDRGISDAFNKGTRQAGGDYLIYLNAGDVLAGNDVLARTAAQMEMPSAATVYYGDFVSIHGGVERHHQASAAVEDFAWDNPINHQSAFIPRRLAMSHPYSERLVLGMDYDFWLRVMPEATFHKLGFPVAVFEMGGRSSSPAWEVHGLVMHRVLWHVNRGTRFTTKDLLVLLKRTARFKLNHALRTVLGKRLSLALRSAKSRLVNREPQRTAKFA